MEENFMCFSRFCGRNNSILTKQYCLDDDGGICKVSAPNFSNGTAETIRIEKISHLEDVIDNLETNECLSTGVFDGPSREIVAKGMLDEVSLAAGVRSRTSEHMVQPPPLGIALLDHDISPYMPDHLICHTPGELMSKLQKAIPGFTFVAYSGAGSCSSGITVTATREPYHGGGLHVYIPVKGIDLPAFQRFLEVKLWNAGLGYIAFARNGAMLVRCMIDLSVLSPERLIYEALSILGDGLSRRPREWQHRGGTTFSGNFNLTQDEIDESDRRVASAKADPENKAKAEQLAAIYHEGKVDALAENKSISRDEAGKLIPRQTAVERNGKECLLHPNDIVEINGNKILISELLERGSEFDKTAMPDPIEGSAYGMTTAKFYFNDGQNSCIHSFAHGVKTVYRFNNKAAIEGKQNHCKLSTGFDIDQAQPMDPSTFPNQKLGSGGKIRLPATIPNLKHLLKGYGIATHYDVIRKEGVIQVPGVSGTSENVSNVMIEYVTSLAILNGIASGPIPGFVSAIVSETQFNPVATWITSSAWDGVDRLPGVYDTLVVREDFPVMKWKVPLK